MNNVSVAAGIRMSRDAATSGITVVVVGAACNMAAPPGGERSNLVPNSHKCLLQPKVAYYYVTREISVRPGRPARPAEPSCHAPVTLPGLGSMVVE